MGTLEERRAKAKALEGKGYDLSQRGKYDEALDCYRQASELDPSNYTYWYNAAVACDRIGDYIGMEHASRKTIKCDGTFIKGYARLAKALIRQGKYSNAMEVIANGMLIDQNDPELHKLKNDVEAKQNNKNNNNHISPPSAGTTGKNLKSSSPDRDNGPDCKDQIVDVLSSDSETKEKRVASGVLSGSCILQDDGTLVVHQAGGRRVQYSLDRLLDGAPEDAVLSEPDDASDSGFSLLMDGDHKNHLRYRNSSVDVRRIRSMRPPPLTRADVADLIDETVDPQHQRGYVDRLEVVESALIEWLAELVQLELHGYIPSSDDIEWIKLIARLYHRYVPEWKALDRSLFRRSQLFPVFISHTGLDKEYAADIGHYLKQKNVQAFLDRDSLDVGVHPDYEMLWAMTSCRRMWCVVSKDYVKKMYPLRELLIGYTRYVQEYQPEGRGFLLILDCFEKEKYRGKWMDDVLKMQSLQIYDSNGKPVNFPTVVRAISDESNAQRYQRIASIQLGGGQPLVALGNEIELLSGYSGENKTAFGQVDSIASIIADNPQSIGKKNPIVPTMQQTKPNDKEGDQKPSAQKPSATTPNDSLVVDSQIRAGTKHEYQASLMEELDVGGLLIFSPPFHLSAETTEESSEPPLSNENENNSNPWSPLPPFIQEHRVNGSMTVWQQKSSTSTDKVVSTGSIIVVGGRIGSDGPALTSVEMLTMASHRWSKLPELNVARHSSSSIVVDGVLYVFGGFGSDGIALASCEMLDLQRPDNAFCVLSVSLPQKRANMGICYYKKKIYLAGGNYNPCCRTCWAFLVQSPSFEELPDLESECRDPSLIVRVDDADEELVIVERCIANDRHDDDLDGGDARSIVEATNLKTKEKRVASGVLSGNCIHLDEETLVLLQADGRWVQYRVDRFLDDAPDAIMSDSLSSDSDSVESDDRYALLMDGDHKNHLRLRNSKVDVRKTKILRPMRPPPLMRAGVADLIDETVDPQHQQGYVDRLEDAESALIEWLAELVQLELHGYIPSSDDIEWIKLIARLYHRYVPEWKALNRSLFRRSQLFPVFISHTGLDKDTYAADIGHYLKQKNVQAFLDRDSLDVGVHPDYEMLWAMTSCRRMWCVVSKDYVKKIYPLRELLIGYTRYVQEYQHDGQGFLLILDFFEQEKYRGEWMDHVFKMQSLQIYNSNGKPVNFPTAVRAIPDESNAQRYQRIASNRLGGGQPLVTTEANVP